MGFSYKRPSGFKIFGIRYYGKDWKDVLLSTCEILAQNDMLKFQSFLNEKTMQGRKVNYLCKDDEDTRSPKKYINNEIFNQRDYIGRKYL